VRNSRRVGRKGAAELTTSETPCKRVGIDTYFIIIIQHIGGAFSSANSIVNNNNNNNILFFFIYLHLSGEADSRIVSIFLFSAVPFVSPGAWPCVFSCHRSFGFHTTRPHTVIINSWRYASLYAFLYNILFFRPPLVTACVVVAT